MKSVMDGAEKVTLSAVWYGDCRNSHSEIPTDRLFTGQRYDDTGLYYYSARYYDPEIGRFISPDTFVAWSTGVEAVSNYLTVNYIPSGLGNSVSNQMLYPTVTNDVPRNPQTINRYSYCLSNPTKYTDPSGWVTWMIPISLSFDIWGLGASGSLSLVWDDNGNWAIVESASTSVTSSVGGSMTITGGVQFTTADEIWDVLEGPSDGQVSVTGGSGVAGSVDVVISEDYWGIGGTVGFGGGLSVSGSVGIYSKVLISNRSLLDISSVDIVMYYFLLTKEIDAELYCSFYTYCDYYEVDENLAFIYLLFYLSDKAEDN